MSKGKWTYGLILGLGLIPGTLKGQADSTFQEATIDIIQSYQPQVRETVKPRWTPSPPPVDTNKARLEFDVPQQALSYTYAALPIRPLSLSRDSLPPSYPDYLLLGLGNRSSKALEASVSRFSTPALDSRIQLHHHSLKGSLENQHSSRTDILASLKTRKTAQPWEMDLGFHHHRFGLYGYDHQNFDFPRDSALAAYTGISATVRTENLLGGKGGWEDAPSLSASVFRTRSGRTETEFQIKAPFQYALGSSLIFSAEALISLAQYDGEGNSLLALRPNLQWRKDRFEARAGLYPSLGSKGGYLLPDLYLAYRPSVIPLRVDLGYHSTIHQNFFQEWVRFNPYVSDRYLPVQARMDEFFAGLGLQLGHRIQAGVKGSWRHYDYFAFLVSSAPQGRYFQLHPFNQVQSLSLSLYGRYQIGDLFSLGLVQEWLLFSGIDGHKPWHMPTWRTQADLSAKPWKGLQIGGYLVFLDGIYASDQIALDPGPDLGLRAEYAWGKRLSAWARVDNLFHSTSPRWWGYSPYGIRGMAGIRFRF